MSNIINGSASESEISSFIGGKPIAAAYAKNQDNPNAYYYEFWSNIRHPDTGETLKAVKGYCNPNNFNECYYAEYRDDAGNPYHYLDSRYYHDPELRGNKSIRQQQSEDAAELERKLDSQKHKDFFEQSSNVEQSQSSDRHQTFFENKESENTNGSTEGDSNAQDSSHTKSNGNGNFNGQS